MTDDLKFIYASMNFITNKNEADIWIYSSNLKRESDGQVYFNNWTNRTFMKLRIFSGKYIVEKKTNLLNHLIQNIIYTNYLSGVANEGAGVLGLHGSLSAHYECRNIYVLWKLNYEN